MLYQIKAAQKKETKKMLDSFPARKFSILLVWFYLYFLTKRVNVVVSNRGKKNAASLQFLSLPDIYGRSGQWWSEAVLEKVCARSLQVFVIWPACGEVSRVSRAWYMVAPPGQWRAEGIVVVLDKQILKLYIRDFAELYWNSSPIVASFDKFLH